MAFHSSDSGTRSQSPSSRPPTGAPSSFPKEYPDGDLDLEVMSKEDQLLYAEEQRVSQARLSREQADNKTKEAAAVRRARRQQESKEERESKALSLEALLNKSQAFSARLTATTQTLGRVGSGMDGEALGQHNLTMAKQPECMIGGTMRDYQLEGLTWMVEICQQGMSGILADEMGLGKTIQTISLIAYLREMHKFLGPHLIIAPLSTLSNWMEEFHKWTPSVPVLMYHDKKTHRKDIFNKKMMKHLKDGAPTAKFPVVCTSPEMVLTDHADLSKVNWQFIIIDEGHRMKNSDSKLFQLLKSFQSETRLLITGTPLQNNLKELWSLLNFLLPTVFTHWEQFEDWFDFSALDNEESTQEFINDTKKKELVRKLHLILQPLLLRRVKADVEHLLPKKREYILYAPMTLEQTQLYNAFTDKKTDTRRFLENKILERLKNAKRSATKSEELTPKSIKKASSQEEDSSDDDKPLALRPRPSLGNAKKTPRNAFQEMMGKSSAANSRASSKASLKRKLPEFISTPASKSTKSSRQSTPASSARSTKTRGRKVYKEADASDEDKLSDDEFVDMLADEAEEKERSKHVLGAVDTKEMSEIELSEMTELAKKEVAGKKLGNPIVQLRLTCNSVHNFYKPWSANIAVDESLVTSSGKMLLLDRLLKSLFERGHKVLVFSQFKVQLDLLEAYAQELRGWNVCRIDGAVEQDDRRQQIKEFTENPEFRLFLLSTRAGGQGINLASADTVILFDSDWNPQQDLQAQDRAHRIGQKNPVVIFRLTTKYTVEDALLRGADAKRRLERAVIKKSNTVDRSYQELTDQNGNLELRNLLLKDGLVFEATGKKGQDILSDADLEILCDRSAEAYERAAKGLSDTDLFKIMETKADGFVGMMENDIDNSDGSVKNKDTNN